MKKGRIAEKIVKGLFKEAGFEVIPYGYEYTVPRLAKKDHKIIGKAARYIRHQPDFIVINNRNEAFFIEVKFRKRGLIKKEDMFNYPCCYVVFLTRDFIFSQSLNYIYSQGENFDLLNKMPPFSRIPNSLIEKYVKKIRRGLGDESLWGQMIEKNVEKLVNKTFLQRITQPTIEGREFTVSGWERLKDIPLWVIRKAKRKYGKIPKTDCRINGEEYKYLLRTIKGKLICFRQKRKKNKKSKRKKKKKHKRKKRRKRPRRKRRR